MKDEELVCNKMWAAVEPVNSFLFKLENNHDINSKIKINGNDFFLNSKNPDFFSRKITVVLILIQKVKITFFSSFARFSAH